MKNNENKDSEGLNFSWDGITKFDIASFTLPKVELKSGIKCTVDKTNEILSSLEEKNRKVSKLVSSRFSPLLAQVKVLSQDAIRAYEMRQYYGTMIVAGSVATFGTIYSIRRGKFSGAFMGALAGVGAHSIVYGKFPYVGQ